MEDQEGTVIITVLSRKNLFKIMLTAFMIIFTHRVRELNCYSYAVSKLLKGMDHF
jgi:hypothetical protein